MYLSQLKLWNFRKFGSGNSKLDLKKADLEVQFTSGLNVLIGENDSGKTAIIDAIKTVLRTHSLEWIRVAYEDFHKDTTRLRIECRFDDLSDNEAKNFIEWLGVEGSGAGAKAYLRVIVDVRREEDRILPFDICAGVDDIGYPLTAEAKEYLKTVYLKPLRDAEAELIPRRNSRLSQILAGHEAFRGKEKDHHLVKLFQELNENIALYFEGKKKKNDGTIEDIADDKKGKELKDEIDKHLKSFCDLSSLFEVSGGELKDILEALSLSFEDKNVGLGTYNRLFISAELLHLHKTNWHGAKIALIEEIEAHLHPQIQLRVIESLQNQKDVQLILTTHSPNLGSKVKLNNLIICQDSITQNAAGEVLLSPQVFPMGEIHTKLEGTDYAFLERFLDVTKANLFFARGVILVEGWSEELLLPVLAKKIGINLTDKSISIVNVGSLAFLRYAKIFKRKNAPFMNMPVAVVTDLDLKPDEESQDEDGKTKKAKAIETNETQFNEQRIKVFTSPHWTLEYCLSQSVSLKNSFISTAKEIHSGTDWNNFDAALADKLDKKKLKKTEIAYKLAQLIEEDSKKTTPEISIQQDDAQIKYLLDAIKYAAGQS